MLKKTITYEDYNGETRTEVFYFNLTRTEVLEMEYSLGPGKSLTETLKVLIHEKDMSAIISTIRDIVLTAYGEKSADGRRFIKNQETREFFEQCPAYDVLYMELATNAEAAAEFLNGIMPQAVTQTLGDNPKQALLDKIKEFEESGKAE